MPRYQEIRCEIEPHDLAILAQRFEERVIKVPDCWGWNGHTSLGYAVLFLQGVKWRAHRISFMLANGFLPPILDHRCNNKLCTNPQHLVPSTNRDNILRGTAPTALHARKTECPQGHPYDETNTRIWNGKRECAICTKKRQQEWNQRRGEQRAVARKAKQALTDMKME